jgi:hypothetical protein
LTTICEYLNHFPANRRLDFLVVKHPIPDNFVCYLARDLACALASAQILERVRQGVGGLTWGSTAKQFR